jgi:lipoyl(octanoyl) transferase
MAAILRVSSAAPALTVRRLGVMDYERTWRAMQRFTATRTDATPDELWLGEHPPVYTMGLKGRGDAVETIHGIPLVYTDRGGDVTYHGPGQLVVYALLDLPRLRLGVKSLVHVLEQSVMDYLHRHGCAAQRRPGAPGVYVQGRKIAALGLRVRGHACYHGLALNVDMDLTPFRHIDPCGYPGLEVTQLADLDVRANPADVAPALTEGLARRLGYNAVDHVGELPRTENDG